MLNAFSHLCYLSFSFFSITFIKFCNIIPLLVISLYSASTSSTVFSKQYSGVSVKRNLTSSIFNSGWNWVVKMLVFIL